MMKKECCFEPGTIVRKSVICLVILATALVSGCIKLPQNPYNCENMPEHLRDLPTTTEYMYVVWRPADQTQDQFEEKLFGFGNNSLEELLTPLTSELRFIPLDETIKSSFNERPRTRDDGSNVAVIISMAPDGPIDGTAIGLSIADIVDPDVADDIPYVAGYQVARAIPLDYVRTWPDQQYSPGLQLVTLLERKPGLDDQTFFDKWHCGDSPLALDIHPFWRYERNVVESSLTPNAPYLDGIVELHARTDFEITNMKTFLGGKMSNGLLVKSSVSSFLKMDTLEANAMREFFVKSDWVSSP